jgi:hypothetical protein
MTYGLTEEEIRARVKLPDIVSAYGWNEDDIVKILQSLFEVQLERAKEEGRQDAIKIAKSLILYGGNRNSDEYNRAIDDLLQALKESK